MLWRSNMLPNRRPESTISRPWTPGGPQGDPRESPEIEQPVQGRFLGWILRSFSMPESIKFQVNLKSLKSWPPREDFNGNWARSKMANLQNRWKNQYVLFNFHFLLISFRESNFQVCMFKMRSKWPLKWLWNDVDFEVRNRCRSEGRMVPRFPGFGTALSRLLRVQWEGKKGWVTAKKDNQTRLCPLQGRRIWHPTRTPWVVLISVQAPSGFVLGIHWIQALIYCSKMLLKCSQCHQNNLQRHNNYISTSAKVHPKWIHEH